MAKQRTITTGHYLDQRRKKDDNTYPVKIRVTYNRKHYFFDSGYSLDEDDYQRICRGKKLPARLGPIFDNLNEQLSKAGKIGNGLKIFTWDAFKKEYFRSNEQQPDNVLFILSEYEKSLRDDGRIGSADTYHGTIQSLISFQQFKKARNPFNLTFSQVTPAFLKSYEQWLLTPRKQGRKTYKARTPTTVGYHMRNIRRAWNIGIREYGANPESYPFGKDKYEIPKSNGRKRFLGENELIKLFNYEPTDESERYYLDMWKLSYLLAGINMRDLCQLRFENLHTDGGRFTMIRYKRHKVSRTAGESANIEIPLAGENRDMVETIIKRWWRGADSKPGDFVFKIIEHGQTPERQTALIKQHTKMANKYMARIAVKLGISERPTTYTARHTFASMMLLRGYGSDFISPFLGHSSIVTTQKYLKGFPDNLKAEALGSIIPK